MRGLVGRYLSSIVSGAFKRRQLYPPAADRSSRRSRVLAFPRLRIWLVGEPGLLHDRDEAKPLRAMPKAGFYAVRAGLKPGIYPTWAECEAQVKGFPGAAYKKLASRGDAEAFIGSKPDKPYARPAKNERDTGESLSEKSDPVLSAASLSALPPALMRLAEDGYTFTPNKPHHLVVYTDGSSRGNGKKGAKAGLGVWWSSQRPASKNNVSERLPGDLQTNNRGELLAIIRALETCPYPDLPLEIRTDSKYAISCMTVYLPNWIRNNFRTSGQFGDPIKNQDLILHLLALLHDRGPKNGVKFKHVAAHQGEVGNEGADSLANQGALSPCIPDRTDWRVPEDVVDSREEGQTTLSEASFGSKPPVDVEIEVDDSWLMSPEEMAALERDM